MPPRWRSIVCCGPRRQGAVPGANDLPHRPGAVLNAVRALPLPTPGSAAAPAHFGLRILCRSNCAAVAGSPSKPTNDLARAVPPLLPECRCGSSSPSRSADVTCGSSAAWVARRARPKPRVSRTPEPMVALLNPAGELDRTPRCAVATRAAVRRSASDHPPT